MLTVGSLFAGVGGLDLGLERAGMRVRWQVENDPYCIRVLAKHWPDVQRYGDIRGIEWSEVEPVDLICGGFPCQPVSVAGARKGDKDDRWLWPEFLRALREVRPRYALVENVPGLLSTDDGRLARGVKGDLAEQGYDSEGGCVSAADVGAPHLRKRVFIIAYPVDARGGSEPLVFTERFYSSLPWHDGAENAMGHAFECGCGGFARWRAGAESENGHSKLEETELAAPRLPRLSRTWNEGGIRQEEICRPRTISERGDSPSFLNFGNWAVEPDVGRVADGVPSRVDRLKCLGNAVVPQVAEYIGKAIIEADNGSRG